MDEPEWIIKAVVFAVHGEQIAEHGGQPGLRDAGLLDSALSRPKNRFGYEQGDIFDLAAACAYGIAKNHPFFDGNKRVSFVTCEAFLNINGWTLTAPDEAAVHMWLSLADGSVSEAALAEWLRTNSQPVI